MADTDRSIRDARSREQVCGRARDADPTLERDHGKTEGARELLVYAILVRTLDLGV